MITSDFDNMIDEVYNHYLNTHHNELFMMKNEMDLTKDQFVNKVTNNYGLGSLFNVRITEQLLNDDTKEITLIYNKKIYKKYLTI